MKPKRILFLLFSLVFFGAQAALCQDAPQTLDANKASPKLSLDEVIDRVERRYAATGFEARFFQVSTITAMDITDTASGRIFVKRPGMMRWEYQKPEPQTIITDGNTLWIYRPEDQQVLIGKAPDFFRNGKGAGFLADIRLLRNKFYITLSNELQNDSYLLKLLPIEQTLDISLIHLLISTKTFDIVRIVTYNAYDDKTSIELNNIQFHQNLDDALFTFKIPEGAEVLHLDE
ncbi:MAG: outer membrane lipoprotein chaperone LolA [Candidatus Desulfatibia sp.]|uniref:outer membrane lipoprotein chaperone LolA n=1 Tax=Candidatus Desulfatibia sp. TaxID=3101189 RepID=UPI002F338E0E